MSNQEFYHFTRSSLFPDLISAPRFFYDLRDPDGYMVDGTGKLHSRY